MATPTRRAPRQPGPGDVVLVNANASVQYRTPFLFQIARVYRYTHTPDGWSYLDGWQLDADGRRVERRDILVQPDRLWIVTKPPRPGRGPESMPRTQRTTPEEAILGQPPQEDTR